MTLPEHKTKIVATIGPASESPEMLERLIRAGLNIARLNFSHGDFTGHAERIARIRAAEKATGRRVALFSPVPEINGSARRKIKINVGATNRIKTSIQSGSSASAAKIDKK